jgi:stage II sporulation protein D
VGAALVAGALALGPSAIAAQGPTARAGEVRVALVAGVREIGVTAGGAWQVDERAGAALLVRGDGGESWRVEVGPGGYASSAGARSRLLRIAGDRGDATPYRPGPFVARAASPAGTIAINGKAYRGAVWFVPTDSGLLVVNVLPVEEYLLSVVPHELGTRAEGDLEALKAQAVAARSFALARARERAGRGLAFDLVATQMDQVYGGSSAEHPLATRAVRETAGEILTVNGRVLAAPYFSACGGRTAEPDEAWAGVAGATWARSVSDRIPGSTRAYCDIAPRAEWRMGFDADDLARALAIVARQRGRAVGDRVLDVGVVERSASGRAATVAIRTDAGRIEVRGAEWRAALRGSRGEMVASTAFSVTGAERRGDRLVWLELAGTGHGHGVGMCQWGAIGRARAGQDYRVILRTYYPGAALDRIG